MKMLKTMSMLVLLASFAGCGGGSERTVPEAQPEGDSFKNVGSHVIHFSALSTDQIPPDVARAYDIVRSKNRAMLNVSVLDAESNAPVEANVSVKTRNLTGQLKNVVIRKIQEQEAIYYIGETPVANRETLVFEVSVTPDGETEPSLVSFKRTFYTD